MTESSHVAEDDYASTLSTLKGMDDGFMISFVDAHSDLNFDDCLKLSSTSGELCKMICATLQLSDKIVLPHALRQKSVLYSFLEERLKTMKSNRIATIKASGGFDGTKKKLNTGALVGYKFQFNGAELATMITHTLSGDHVDIDPTITLIKKGEQVVKAHDDLQAHIVKPPKTKVFLSSFFATAKEAQQKGPYAIKHYTGAQYKLLEPDVAARGEALSQRQMELSSPGKLKDDEAAKSEKLKTQMDAARKAAREKMEADQRANTVVL